VAYWSYVGAGRQEVTMDRVLKKKRSHDREFFFDFDSRRLFVIWIVACSFVACS
jgi:hypothetical protein